MIRPILMIAGIACASAPAFAAPSSTRPPQAAKGGSEKISHGVSRAAPPAEQTVVYRGGAEIAAGTLLFQGGLDGGTRNNFFIVQPEFGVDFKKEELSLNVDVPISWTTDLGGTQDRIIGRPSLDAHRWITNTVWTKASYGVGVKLPLFDASFGGAELYRAWQFSLDLSADQRINREGIHILGDLNLAYDTATSRVYDDLGVRDQFTVDRAPVLRTTVGLAKEGRRQVYGMAFHSMNGVGKGHAHAPFYQSGQIDVEAVSFLSGEIFANFQAAPDTVLSASLRRGFNTLENQVFAAALSSFDNQTEIAALGLSLGVTRRF